MSISTTLRSARTQVDTVAFDSVPIPGLSDRLNTLGGWVTFLVYFATLAALLIAGGYLAWDKVTDHGGGKGVKIAIGAIGGTMVAASATTIINAAQA